jgi:hypothetical protein
MILNLCIANALALWVADDRDQIIADAIKKHTTEVEALLVYINKPPAAPVSCYQAREFLDEWLVPVLAANGVTVHEVIHGSCNAGACTCENSSIVCAGDPI